MIYNLGCLELYIYTYIYIYIQISVAIKFKNLFIGATHLAHKYIAGSI